MNIKSKNRVNEFGEVFTAQDEINGMLDLVRDESYRIDSRFLEPACGNGNFLANVLSRKLILPAVICSRPKRHLPIVVFPDPDSPTKAKVSPLSRLNETSLTA